MSDVFVMSDPSWQNLQSFEIKFIKEPMQFFLAVIKFSYYSDYLNDVLRFTSF